MLSDTVCRSQALHLHQFPDPDTGGRAGLLMPPTMQDLQQTSTRKSHKDPQAARTLDPKEPLEQMGGGKATLKNPRLASCRTGLLDIGFSGLSESLGFRDLGICSVQSFGCRAFWIQVESRYENKQAGPCSIAGSCGVWKFKARDCLKRHT